MTTCYKGYRFRSRLEARWAIFFDQLCLNWNYEAEGFKLPSGCYLPDFDFHQAELYVEIKPRRDPEPQERTLASELAMITNRRVLMLCGDPWPMEFNGFLFDPIEQGHFPIVYSNITFAECRKCEGEVWIHSGELASPLTAKCLSCPSEGWPLTDTPFIQWAYEAARGARFER